MSSENSLNSYRHLFLFSKGWYLETDGVEDLRKIVAKIINYDKPSLQNIISISFQAISEYISKKDINFYHRMLLEYGYKDMWKNDSYTLSEAMLKTHLGIMRYMSSEDYGNLGEPDYSLLPMSEYCRKEKEKNVSKD
jgi:hypothetical protein